jgi:hypothetical protein
VGVQNTSLAVREGIHHRQTNMAGHACQQSHKRFRVGHKQMPSAAWVSSWAAQQDNKWHQEREKLVEQMARKLPGAPPPPKTAFVLFSADARKDLVAVESPADLMKRLASQWAALEPAKKARYQESAATEQTINREEMKKIRGTAAFRELESSVDRFMYANSALHTNGLPEMSVREWQKKTCRGANAAGSYFEIGGKFPSQGCTCSGCTGNPIDAQWCQWHCVGTTAPRFILLCLPSGGEG